jgi:hypothetical protein
VKLHQAQHERLAMVHEYIEDLALLTSALQAGHEHVSTLVKAGEVMITKATQLMNP